MKRVLALFILGILAVAVLQPLRALAAPSNNLIVNASMEVAANSTTPSGWVSNKWGTNTSNFTYLTTGHTGSRSVKTQVTAYTDGDAKWYFEPVDVVAGASYKFNDFYKSNTVTEVVVQLTHQDNSVSYQWLGNVQASTSWAQTTFTFAIPAGVAKASVLHALPAVGTLTIDDASLEEVDVAPPAPNGNLISNSSLEAANGATPASWVSNKWGTNTSNFTYLTTGHTGSRSVKTQVTAYTDGDAKWYFEPATITAGSRYDYKDYYKSDVTTDLFAWFTHADGSSTYEWLGTSPASSTWQQASFSFVAPQTAARVSIFHTVSSVGWLTIDDAELTLAQAVPANPVPNPSLEQASVSDPNVPANWLSNHWGTNTSNFEYMNEGYGGNKSVKVTMSAYTDGDAKWYFEPQHLDPGVYRISARYKTNTAPRVVAMHLKADGTAFYADVPKPLPSGSTADWQLYSDTFLVPQDAAKTSIMFLLSGNGWLQTDDFLIEPYSPTGFDRPLVTLTFDDGEEDNITTALPVMATHGFKSTQCFATDFAEGSAANSAAIVEFYNNGHEVCSHTVSHPALTTLGATDLAYELAHSKSFLEGLIGVPVKNFASPYGDYNTSVVGSIMQQYRSHRTVDTGYNSKDNFDIRRIRVQNMLSTTTLQEFQQWLDCAKATNTWLVLVYHRVADNPGQYDTYETDFTAQMQALTSSGLTVKTYNDALDELVPQM